MGGQFYLSAMVAKTVLDQGHLCPLPLSVRPVFWGFDHSLRLIPQPNALFLGDQYDQFVHEYRGTNIGNPGSFSTDFSFVVFWPSTGEMEFSRVP